MGQRRRILVDVQPRVLRDALATVLENVGLDEVLVIGPVPADRTSMSYDAAILSHPDQDVHADVVIELPDTGDNAVIHLATGPQPDQDVRLRTPDELLALLDRLCPAPSNRVTPAPGSPR